jgi:hypothetical protein
VSGTASVVDSPSALRVWRRQLSEVGSKNLQLSRWVGVCERLDGPMGDGIREAERERARAH